MRVLITGIDGFVGSHMAELLLGVEGVEIHGTVLDAGGGNNISHLRGAFPLHQVNITDAQQVTALLGEVRPDRVIHLAGQAFVPDSLVSPVNTFQANIIGGVSILEAARLQQRHGGHDIAVLLVSSGEVYGRVNSSLPVTEEFPLSPTNPYAASKASIDMIAQQYASSFNVNVIIVRPFNHAGPRQSLLFVCSDFGRQFAEIAAGNRSPEVYVGNIDVWRDFTDVRDVVRAYWKLFDRTSKDFLFNVCSGRAVQIRELLVMLQEISAIKVEAVATQDRRRLYDVSRVVGSFDRLRQATGWEPHIPLRQTLLDVFSYWSTVGSAGRHEATNPR